jgi:hypothetical protein
MDPTGDVMRAFVQRSLTCAVVGLAAGPSGRMLAQPVEEPEEIVVRAKPLNRYRAEIELARDEMIRVFNEANEGEDNDVRCRYETPTGSRIPARVCFSAAQDRASAGAARDLLNGLFLNRGAEMVAAAVNAADGESRAMLGFEKEWRRVMGTNQQFRDAVVKYRELENEFDRARGETIRIPIPVFALKDPQCEASTYTEYEQRGNVARVTGTVSISACPAGTNGKFALVARVRDDAGTSTPIEFSEAWESPDAQDYIFFADYPIGDDVFLESVRVRNLRCACEDPTQ